MPRARSSAISTSCNDGAAREADEQLVGEFAQRQRRPHGERVTGRKTHAQRFDHQSRRRELRIVNRLSEEAEVQRSIAQGDELVESCAFADLQAHGELDFAKRDHERRNDVARHAWRHTEPQDGRPPAAQVLDRRFQALRASEQVAGFKQQSVACLRQLDAAGMSAEQRHAHLRLQCPDLLAQRGLADEQAGGRLADVPLLGYGHEIPQQAQFDGHDAEPNRVGPARRRTT